jgi:tellurite resistance protein
MNPTPLKFLMPGWFSVVMGLTGLALAWLGAVPVLGDAASGVALVLGGLAAVVGVLLLALSVLRFNRHPEALAEDLRHPVRHAFVAALPVAVLLLATLGAALGLSGLWLSALWWAGSLGQLWATVWVLKRWLVAAPAAPGGTAPPFWPVVTPVLLIPVVGNVIAPLAGVPLGHAVWAMAQFGIGLLLWPVVLALLLARRAAAGALPERLLPTWFIPVAPPSVIGLVAAQAGWPLPAVAMLWGMALFFLLWAGTVAQQAVAQPFSLTFWALSFPLAAFSSLTLKLAALSAVPGLQVAGMLVLALASLVIFSLCLGTFKGLRDGTLLAPEPVAAIVPAQP